MVGGFFIGVAGRDHHGIDFQLVVEEIQHAPHGLGGVGVEECRVGGDAKAPLLGFADGFYSGVEHAVSGYGQIVAFLQTVYVHSP